MHYYVEQKWLNEHPDNEQQNVHVVMGDTIMDDLCNYSASEDDMVDEIMDDIMKELASKMARDPNATLHDVNNGETHGVE